MPPQSAKPHASRRFSWSGRARPGIAEQKRLAKLKAERDAKIRAERAKAAAAARSGKTYTPRIPAPVHSDPTPSNYLSYPAYGPTTSGFGMRWHPVLQKWMLHDGLDWGIACGTPVQAAAPGTVIRAGWRESGWGNQILIDHGIHRGVDLVTSYNHLSSIVDVGRHRAARPAHRLQRYHRLLDRLPSALRRLRGRHSGQPAQLALTLARQLALTTGSELGPPSSG